MFFVSKSLDDTKKFASDLINRLSKNKRATILALTGDLGAGKTTLTQKIAEVLGVTGRVTSPTYVIAKMYDTDHAVFKKLVHIDAYRLQGGDDLLSLGWKELIEDRETLIVLEWPEKVAEILPADIIRIEIDPINDTTRNIETYGEKEN